MAWNDLKDVPPPVDGEEYIVATSTGVVTALYYSHGSWTGCNDVDDYWQRVVTHWMEMPKHPSVN